MRVVRIVAFAFKQFLDSNLHLRRCFKCFLCCIHSACCYGSREMHSSLGEHLCTFAGRGAQSCTVISHAWLKTAQFELPLDSARASNPQQILGVSVWVLACPRSLAGSRLSLDRAIPCNHLRHLPQEIRGSV